MGPQAFIVAGHGRTADEAFQLAIADAEFKYGSDGYTGSIAEKDSFVMIECPKDEVPTDFANALIDAQDERINNKWGPAGCIQTGPTMFVFFGWASC